MQIICATKKSNVLFVGDARVCIQRALSALRGEGLSKSWTEFFCY